MDEQTNLSQLEDSDNGIPVRKGGGQVPFEDAPDRQRVEEERERDREQERDRLGEL